MTGVPSCTSCGRELKAHCPSPADPATTRCAWWRCTNRISGVDLTDYTRGIRRLTTGAIEQITPPS